MKALFTFAFAFSYFIATAGYFADPALSLFDKVATVNKEWHKHPELRANLTTAVTFRSDEAVIQTHLRLVEAHLRNNVPGNISPQQLENRLYALDHLRQYWQAGRFPQNHYHPNRQPYFIDNHGTACAVGYLMISTGHAADAWQVHRIMNYAYISEIPEGALDKWAIQYGFTREELAWIQPGYSTAPTFTIDSVPAGISGTVTVVNVDPNTGHLVAGGLFTAGALTGAENLIAFDGANWFGIGNPNGTVQVVHPDPQGLIVAGDFTAIDGFPTGPIARQYGSAWIPMGTGLDGTVHTIHFHNGNWYAGGIFYNQLSVPYYLARLENGTWGPAPIGTNGIVRALETYEGHLAIGGSFTVVADTPCKNLALWNGITVLPVIADGEVYSMAVHNMMGMTKPSLAIGMKFNPNTQWSALFYTLEIASGGNAVTLHGYLFLGALDSTDIITSLKSTSTGLLVSGRFFFAPMYGHHGTNAVMLADGGNPYALASTWSNTVHDMAAYNGHLYAVGAFDSVNTQPIRSMAKVNTTISGINDHGTLANQYHMHHGPSSLNCQWAGVGDLPQGPALLFDLQGRQAAIGQAIGNGIRFQTGNLAKGIYLVQMPTSDGGTVSDKVYIGLR